MSDSEKSPKYHQITNSIRARIISGELPAGESVPSERQLCQEWGVARPTAADALRLLRHQGYVESRHGSGTFVRADLPGAHGKRFAPSRTIDVSFPADAGLEVLVAEEAAVPPHVADAFGTPDGSRGVRRQVLVSDPGGTPAELRTSWFGGDLTERAPDLLDKALAPAAVDEYVTDRAGHRPSFGRDQVQARLATAAERKRLQLPGASAVLEQHLVVFDAEGSAFRFDESVFPAEVWKLLHPYPLS
ncbi:GntR family transcriptional regulator [Amycolatopsis sp. 195334CR]|uniref:GntR family transcriptional regulator n=1 Tax=Amycolatopsis sp. 195334CR TaxID=2814588 RepID=UPI001A90BC87|nr:GntR family transcriptional regulator [Amycolatopsis sp. 195334CR]MBN6038797.1 GntR family transcriptional regulator [Amycolatopsis sp. 195334CR]